MAKEEQFDESGLVVGTAYTRVEIAKLCRVKPPINSREWTGIREYQNVILLFVTLDKTNFDPTNQYDDIFDDEGQTLFWESQRGNTVKTEKIKRIIAGDSVILFCREREKIKGKTLPFVYVGHLKAENYEGEKPVSFEYTVLDFQDEPNEALQELYLWKPNRQRRKRTIETNPERKKRQKIKSEKSQLRKGQGRLVDAAKKKAIELRAMDVARKHYESISFEVIDTSSNKPYDFECLLDDKLRRVEVKGTTQGLSTVNVTINEVTSARSDECQTDLFIVHNIKVTGETPNFDASGGETKLIENWYPEDENLSPTAFVYNIP